MENLIQQLAESIESNSRSMLMLSASPFPPGLQVLTTQMELIKSKPAESPEEEEEDDTFYDEQTYSGHYTTQQLFYDCLNQFQSGEPPAGTSGAIRATYSANRIRSAGAWWVKNGKPALKAPERNQKDFLESLANRKPEDGPLTLQIQVLSRADADALKDSE
jgi:hypothetical protein